MSIEDLTCDVCKEPTSNPPDTVGMPEFLEKFMGRAFRDVAVCGKRICITVAQQMVNSQIATYRVKNYEARCKALEDRILKLEQRLDK